MSQTLCKKNISRLMALLLCVLMLLPCIPAVHANGGSCGDTLTWSLDGNTLTISGSGGMNNYTARNPAPWYDYRESIMRVSLPEGLTRVGNMAFYGCTNLASVSIPSSVVVIGVGAFYQCSGLTMLNLSNGLVSIERQAFSQCSALADLRLPGSLNMIKTEAFYMCSGLTYVTIPASVYLMEDGVFSYCSNLIRVDVSGSVSVPTWSFYGCDNLEIVTVQGSSVNPESYMVPSTPSASSAPSTQPAPSGGVVPSGSVTVPAQPAPTQPQPTEPAQLAPTQPPMDIPAPEEGRATVVVTPSGSEEQNTTSVKKTENSTTVSQVQTSTEGTGDIKIEISSTVQNDDGWEEVIGQINSAELSRTEETVDVTVYTPNSSVVSQDVLQELSGKNVTVNIHTQSGASFKLDCSKLPEEVKEDLELSYTLVPAEDIPKEMEGCTVYQLSFHNSSDVRVEMLMRLPGDHGYQTATLYRMDKKQPLQLQSVMVDAQSNAHWYLRSIDHKQEYLIGINIPGATTESPIIPAELAGIHKVANVYDGVEYVVTGRSSSWNMGLGRVMAILAAVMVSAIVVIGFVMFSLNKRRLKNGYMPDWSDEDEE